MSLDVTNLDEQIIYNLEGEEFKLKVDHMFVTDKFKILFKELNDITEKNKDVIAKALNRKNGDVGFEDVFSAITKNPELQVVENLVRKQMVKILHWLLEGNTKKLTVENLRISVFLRVLSDFFSQSTLLTKK